MGDVRYVDDVPKDDGVWGYKKIKVDESGEGGSEMMQGRKGKLVFVCTKMLAVEVAVIVVFFVDVSTVIMQHYSAIETHQKNYPNIIINLSLLYTKIRHELWCSLN